MKIFNIHSDEMFTVLEVACIYLKYKMIYYFFKLFYLEQFVVYVISRLVFGLVRGITCLPHHRCLNFEHPFYRLARIWQCLDHKYRVSTQLLRMIMMLAALTLILRLKEDKY